MSTSGLDDRLVIVVDFGTTNSGVAVAYSGTPVSPDEIVVIKTWPGGNGLTSDKVASEISYDPISGKARWGSELKPEEDRFRCMKLMLDSRQTLPSYVSQSDLRAKLVNEGKSAQDVVSDYLKLLWRHAKEQLVLKYGAAFMASTKKDFILTVPAVWSDAAKNATMLAARRAGVGPNLALISEPEAAAVYTLKSMQPNHLRVGDYFIVCDAGGGTVDLIPYEIKQVSPLKIEESAEGSGGCCGAGLLNLRFEEHVRSTMGAATFDRLRKNKPRSWQTALKSFEDYVKRMFNPDKDDEYSVPFPAVADGEANGVEEGFFTMTSTAMWDIFEPIIKDIILLIESQMHRLEVANKSINGIVLVGGFGQSTCLLRKLQAKFEYLNPPPPYPGTLPAGQRDQQAFEIMQPHNAWTAVVRGGVLRGLEGKEFVTSRKSRRHYGVRFRCLFNPKVHPASCKKWDKYEEEFIAEDRMEWYIKKGQDCDSSEPISFPFYRNIPKKGKRTVYSSLMVCGEDHAPDAAEEGSNSPTRVLCTLEADLNKVQKRFWKQHTNSKGDRYASLSYKLGMQITSGTIKFDLRVDDTVYGNVTATFD